MFASRGVGASVDEVAEAAGLTKGAVYGHFESKEDLFLAMLDERVAARLEEIRRAARSPQPPEAQARQAGLDLMESLDEDPSWERLFFEFSAYALRNPAFRDKLVARYARVREVEADIYRRRAEELGIDSPVPPELLSVMTFAMANGIALERTLEPDVVPDYAFALMLGLFFRGLVQLAEEESGGAASVHRR